MDTVSPETDPARIWFTADTHFGHANIIRYCDRPFGSLEEMDEALIERWNERVASGDVVYHLGDVALCSPGRLEEILDRLQGTIYLVTGNHERSARACEERFGWVRDYHELRVNDEEGPNLGAQLVVLFHYAQRVWNAAHHGSWQLYGHSHGQLPDDPRLLAIDVGVDCHGYAPIHYREVKAIMAERARRAGRS